MRKSYPAEFKTKVALEALPAALCLAQAGVKGERGLAELASRYEV